MKGKKDPKVKVGIQEIEKKENKKTRMKDAHGQVKTHTHKHAHTATHEREKPYSQTCSLCLYMPRGVMKHTGDI